MKNLLEETKEALAELGKGICDIKWIGGDLFTISLEDFVRLADSCYPKDWRGPYVATDLRIHVGDHILIREEYDGTEKWKAVRLSEPTETRAITALTIFQSTKAKSSNKTLIELNKK